FANVYPPDMYFINLPFFITISFFIHDPATTAIYTLSLHDALPICLSRNGPLPTGCEGDSSPYASIASRATAPVIGNASTYEKFRDRKSTRLNSSHLGISYAVFCLKKKKKIKVYTCEK